MRGVVLDLDGTVYESTDPIPGAPEAIAALRDRGVEVLFASNTSTKSRETCRDRLRNIGVEADAADILTSASVAASHVATAYEGRRVFALGSTTLHDELANAGVPTTENPDAADVVVVGKDRDIDWERLTRVVRAAVQDVPFVATNRDRTSPTSSGVVPGTGALVAAIAWAVDRDPDIVAGKPQDPMIDAIDAKLDCPLSEAVVIGDNLESDVALGERAGMGTVLVLSGVATEADVASRSNRPDHIVASLADLDASFDA